MANIELITSYTVPTGGVDTITLPNTGTLPQTYTDLKLIVSAKTTKTTNYGAALLINFNSSSSGYSDISIRGDSGSTASYSNAVGGGSTYGSEMNTSTGSLQTNIFSNNEIYIPNYSVAGVYKSISVDGVAEINSSSSNVLLLTSSLWSNNAAITTITITCANGPTFAEGSTFYLYGISNVTSTTKATGGIVSSDGTYNYHMFPYSGTFTPTVALTNVDFLVIAGGGGGSYGGGGAGGLRSTVTATGGGGSLESKLSLSATDYTVTVGAGGAAGSAGNSYQGQNGSNSVFSTITSTGGGGSGYTTPQVGGSGAGRGDTGSGAAATSSPVQGYAGGSGTSGGAATGGGGGAGAVGGNGNSSGNVGGNGGNGVQITAFANATQTGANNGYYAGGGGGGYQNFSNQGGVGGLGGGGNGTRDVKASAGITNTGGGGAGSYASGADFSNGGSGLVIIRYAI